MRHSSHWVRAAALGLLLGFAISSTPAAATAVRVYADGSEDYGFDPDDVAAAVTAGANGPIEVPVLGAIGVFTVTTGDSVADGFIGTDKTNPSTGTGTWTIHMEQDREDFALIILGHDPNDPIAAYETGNLGIEFDTEGPYAFVSPTDIDILYLALFLGDVEGGTSYSVQIGYLLAQSLELVDDGNGGVEYVFPRYVYAYALIPSLPEPSTLALLLVGVGAVAIAGRAR